LAKTIKILKILNNKLEKKQKATMSSKTAIIQGMKTRIINLKLRDKTSHTIINT